MCDSRASSGRLAGTCLAQAPAPRPAPLPALLLHASRPLTLSQEHLPVLRSGTSRVPWGHRFSLPSGIWWDRLAPWQRGKEEDLEMTPNISGSSRAIALG